MHRPVDRIAREAYRDFGRGGGHPARLNLGDCFAYALARKRGEPLLFKGDDFVHTDIEPLSLPASQATPVGLIVAEVVTNAFKHAFKDRTSGRIDLTVRRLGLSEVEVEIRDDGDGYPAPRDDTRGGLGARLIVFPEALMLDFHLSLKR